MRWKREKEGAEGGGRCREQSGRHKAEGKAPLTRDNSAKVARGSVKTTYLMHSLKLFALYDVNTPLPLTPGIASCQLRY